MSGLLCNHIGHNYIAHILRSHLTFVLRGRNEATHMTVQGRHVGHMQYYNTEHDSPVKCHFLVPYQVTHKYVCFLEEPNIANFTNFNLLTKSTLV